MVLVSEGLTSTNMCVLVSINLTRVDLDALVNRGLDNEHELSTVTFAGHLVNS